MANISIGGNVTDSVLVYGNDNFVVKIGDVNGGVVNIIKPADKPKYSARPTPVVLKPRTFRALLDRESEFEVIKKAVQLSSPVSIWGEEGIGKTSFIRHLAHTLDMGDFTSGIVFLDVSGLGYEDLLQALFDLFFDSEPSYKPTLAEITKALQNIKAVIFLDDIHISRDEVPSILDAVPHSLFILSSTERSIWGEGKVVPLRGLPESESLKLFNKELSRPLTEPEKAIVSKICSALQGHPLQILQAASLARDSGSSLEDLLKEISNEKTENKAMAYMNMAYLSDSEKQILALLAAAGGNIVSLDHLNGIFKNNSGQKDTQRLISLGLVQAHSPRFSITGALVSSISATWDITSWQDVLLNYAINWISSQPASMLVEESSDLLIHTLKDAGERKKWREVIQLGKSLEKFMVYYKRWQKWSDILNLILTAAKALKESKIQAWALHQLGSRALFLGHASEAKAFLSQALSIRNAIGDKAGLAITQHNINTLNGIIAPIKGKTSGCRKYLNCGCGAAAGLTILAIIAWVTISALLPDTPPYIPPTEPPAINKPTDTPSPTITNTPTVTPTGTIIPSITPTITPAPELLYDFVINANEAEWDQPYFGTDKVEILEFYKEPKFPNPEQYLVDLVEGYAYVGWDYDVPMVGEKNQKQVLLTYPYYNYTQITGLYNVFFPAAPNDAYLEIKVGYKDVPAKEPVGATFTIQVNDNLVFDEFSHPAKNPTINAPVVLIKLFEGTNIIRLEINAQDVTANQDYPIWAVVKLWDRNP